jgi:hypothetical protein
MVEHERAVGLHQCHGPTGAIPEEAAKVTFLGCVDPVAGLP